MLKEFVLCTSLPVTSSPGECCGPLYSIVCLSAGAFLLTTSELEPREVWQAQDSIEEKGSTRENFLQHPLE